MTFQLHPDLVEPVTHHGAEEARSVGHLPTDKGRVP